jgi:hypothetical protein
MNLGIVCSCLGSSDEVPIDKIRVQRARPNADYVACGRGGQQWVSGMRVRSRLDDGDMNAGVFTQPCGQREACYASTNDDIVVCVQQDLASLVLPLTRDGPSKHGAYGADESCRREIRPRELHDGAERKEPQQPMCKRPY